MSGQSLGAMLNLGCYPLILFNALNILESHKIQTRLSTTTSPCIYRKLENRRARWTGHAPWQRCTVCQYGLRTWGWSAGLSQMNRCLPQLKVSPSEMFPNWNFPQRATLNHSGLRQKHPCILPGFQYGERDANSSRRMPGQLLPPTPLLGTGGV